MLHGAHPSPIPDMVQTRGTKHNTISYVIWSLNWVRAAVNRPLPSCLFLDEIAMKLYAARSSRGMGLLNGHLRIFPEVLV